MSYLKLIPKAGKDLQALTNWRPISLSNCDHKIITKTYAQPLCEVVASKISENQTAYIKGRLINDNIRSMLATVNLANLDETAEGILIALDAKKAFDSVSHKYIEGCLIKFGCKRFVKIFNVLYNDLTTDIIVNGRVTKGFRVLRGVKQGDALSCILFIMCMEPLLRNIENNPVIEPIVSQTLGTALPKVYGYADDFNLSVKNKIATVQAVFAEYERLSKLSGLVLNADKTEILRLGTDRRELEFDVDYMNQRTKLRTTNKAKINGILFQNDPEEMAEDNVRAVLHKVDKQLKSWSRRSLSTLGKILICKTFGISQVIYLMQSVMLKECHIKRINAILYKFIWNRHYLAAKAPERIKRDIVCTPVKRGGLGMLDIADLDKSIKLKMLGRLLKTKHPFLLLIKNQIVLDFFKPSCRTSIENPTIYGLELVAVERDKLWGRRELCSNVAFLHVARGCTIKSVLTPNGARGIAYFMIRRRGKNLIGDLTEIELQQLRRFVKGTCYPTLEMAVRMNLRHVARMSIEDCIYINGKFKSLATCSTKEIRESTNPKQLITSFKVGLDLNERDSRNWLFKLSKLTSVQHKGTLLKIAHGEIYTQERLVKFGLTNESSCPRCDCVEDLEHKIYRCHYVERIWNYFLRITAADVNLDRLETVMGVHSRDWLLCVHAELLKRILLLRSDQNYLTHPKHFVDRAIKSLRHRERNTSNKEALQDLLERVETRQT
jgi:hypothetical protein